MTTDLLGSTQLPRLLAADLAERRAERAWRSEFAPRLSYGRHAGPPRRDARRAAVALLLCRRDQTWSIPLTVRSDRLVRHRGQVCFPGGLIDPGETPTLAAAREVCEELGVEPPIEWLGGMDPLYVFASGAVATPCVGAIDFWPDWVANPAEVASVFPLPLQDLLDAGASTMTVRRGPLEFSAPRLVVEGRSVWGSTAVLLGELRGRLRRVVELAAV